jgi:hypothetical protein
VEAAGDTKSISQEEASRRNLTGIKRGLKDVVLLVHPGVKDMMLDFGLQTHYTLYALYYTFYNLWR